MHLNQKFYYIVLLALRINADNEKFLFKMKQDYLRIMQFLFVLYHLSPIL